MKQTRNVLGYSLVLQENSHKETHIEKFWFQFVESDVYSILTTTISENEGRLEMFMKHYAPNMYDHKDGQINKVQLLI